MEMGNSKVLARKVSNLNMETGEITVKEESVLLRTKKRERFMLLYVENFSAIVSLRKNAQKILAQILTRKVTFGTNEVALDSVFRTELAEYLNTSRQVITNSITELVEKKILKREKRSGGYVYFLNSFLFGQGEWNSIERQRQQFTIDYDFKNYTAEKEIKSITAYKGLPDKEDIQIIKREHYKDEEGVEREDVIIDIKDTNDVIENNDNGKIEENIVENKSFYSLTDKEQEIVLLREKNREKELSVKELELKVKLKEMELEKSKLVERSLFDE